MRSMTVLGFVWASLSAAAVYAADGGEVSIKAGRGADAYFSHVVHGKGARLTCRDCHPKLYLDPQQHTKVSMKEMQKGKSCGTCHDGTRAFSVDGDCARCHIE